jgi:histidinol phosphatase-like enzyme (inositol monophosphatase family)
MPSASPDLRTLLDVAIDVARRAGKHTLQYFNRGVAVEIKSDQSPVTQADKEAEIIARDAILERFPTHSVLGEEHGTVEGDPDYQWVIDPIDGTKSFIHGVPLYTTLIGLQIKNKPAVGVIYAPALDEIVHAADGLGAMWNGVRCEVSKTDRLDRALITTSDILMATGRSDAFPDLARRCKYSRTWGDGYGYMLVATGRADIMADPKMSPWDVCALIPVIKAAGGVCTSWKGEETIHGGDLFACNAALASEVHAALRGG